MRPWMEKVYGIPPEQVIGSSIRVKYKLRDDKPVLVRLSTLNWSSWWLAGRVATASSSVTERDATGYGRTTRSVESSQYHKWRLVRVLTVDHRSSPLGDPGLSAQDIPLMLNVRSHKPPTDTPRLHMKNFIHLALMAFLLSLPCREVVSADPLKEDPLKAIEEATAAFAAAYAKGDAKAIAEMYTENARVLPPNAKVVENRKAIEEFWKGAMDAGIKAIELKTVEVESFGDTIVEQGTATLFGKDEVVVDKIKYLVVWKRVGGKWRLHRDCWNSSEPAPKN